MEISSYTPHVFFSLKEIFVKLCLRVMIHDLALMKLYSQFQFTKDEVMP